MSTIESLQELKDILMDKGWCQGKYQDGEGRLCLRGAMNNMRLFLNNVVTLSDCGTYDVTFCGTYDKVYWSLQKQIGPERGITYWNDAPGRTFNEVIDLIDNAILAEKEAKTQ